MALAITSYRIDGGNGKTAIGIYDDKRGLMVCSLPARLNNHEMPKLREARRIVEGRDIESSTGFLDTFDAVGFGQRSAEIAFDCRNEYGGLEKAIAAHRVNVVDTLGDTDRTMFKAAALAEFDARVTLLRSKEPAPVAAIAYRDMPLSDVMARQRERLFSRMTSYQERGEFSALVTKEAGLQGVFWLMVIRKGAEVVFKDLHYNGPDYAQRRAAAMLDHFAPKAEELAPPPAEVIVPLDVLRKPAAPGDAVMLATAIMAGFYEAHSGNAGSAVDCARDATKEAMPGAEYLYNMIASWCDVMAELKANDIEAPGVFAYDVAEAFGAWLYDEMAEHGRVPESDQCAAKLGGLAVNHMLRDGGDVATISGQVFAILKN